MKTVWLAIAGSAPSIGAGAAELSVPGLASAPAPVHFVLWGCAILVAILTLGTVLIRFLREWRTEMVKAVKEVDNPDTGMAAALRRELELVRREQTAAGRTHEEILRGQRQLLHTHQEQATTGELMAKMDQQFGALSKMIEVARGDVNRVGQTVKGVEGRVVQLEQRAERTEARLDDIERKVGT